MTSLLGPERRSKLLATLKADGIVRTEAVADLLGVSVMTVRRDLADLEAEGVVRRVRGGAVSAPTPRSFGERSATRASVKEKIARKAVELVPRSGVIALDASTTTGLLAGQLGTQRELILATNSIDNAMAAHKVPGVRAHLVGGEVDALTGSLVGPLAAQSANRLVYDVFFTSAAAVDPSGTSEATLEEGHIKTVFSAASRRTVLLVDSSKLDSRASAHAIDWDAIDTMITELAPDDSRLTQYKKLANIF
jgi:DeoR family glycerol-3-phosphate regulon repressor